MSGAIAWFVELAFRPGRREAFRALSREMTAAAAAEAGTLVYERFASDDGTRAFVYERYASSAAAVTHLIGFNARFAGLVRASASWRWARPRPSCARCSPRTGPASSSG